MRPGHNSCAFISSNQDRLVYEPAKATPISLRCHVGLKLDIGIAKTLKVDSLGRLSGKRADRSHPVFIVIEVSEFLADRDAVCQSAIDRLRRSSDQVDARAVAERLSLQIRCASKHH